MHPDRFTIKSQEALQAAQQLAEARHNPQTTPEHLLAVLLEQNDGIVAPVLRKLGVDPAAVRVHLTPALDDLPKLATDNPEPTGGSSDLTDVLKNAEKEMRKLQDEYVSTEHLALALAAYKGPAGKALRNAGATEADLTKALEEVRGSNHVTSQNPEDTVMALD
jgi:ATP-dependent Clp protease ATP-binding subunit ClpB